MEAQNQNPTLLFFFFGYSFRWIEEKLGLTFKHTHTKKKKKKKRQERSDYDKHWAWSRIIYQTPIGTCFGCHLLRRKKKKIQTTRGESHVRYWPQPPGPCGFGGTFKLALSLMVIPLIFTVKVGINLWRFGCNYLIKFGICERVVVWVKLTV